jgi:hypothetical protein
MISEELRTILKAEIADARRSYARGNYGRARVCARRAAGWSVGEYLELHQLGEAHGNALEHLKWLVEDAGTPEALRAAAIRLTTTIDEDGSLPFDQDPIEDAKLIIQGLLGYDVAALE